MKETLKDLFSRKFLAMAIGLGLLWAGVFTGALKDTQQVLVMASSTLLLCFAYIGGNIWTEFITSKYFHPDLVGK